MPISFVRVCTVEIGNYRPVAPNLDFRLVPASPRRLNSHLVELLASTLFIYNALMYEPRYVQRSIINGGKILAPNRRVKCNRRGRRFSTLPLISAFPL